MLVSSDKLPGMPTCIYCGHKIYMENPGWGWLDNMEYFHTECLAEDEGINI
jgi:hypothetical protein